MAGVPGCDVVDDEVGGGVWWAVPPGACPSVGEHPLLSDLFAEGGPVATVVGSVSPLLGAGGLAGGAAGVFGWFVAVEARFECHGYCHRPCGKRAPCLFVPPCLLGGAVLMIRLLCQPPCRRARIMVRSVG